MQPGFLAKFAFTLMMFIPHADSRFLDDASSKFTSASKALTMYLASGLPTNRFRNDAEMVALQRLQGAIGVIYRPDTEQLRVTVRCSDTH